MPTASRLCRWFAGALLAVQAAACARSNARQEFGAAVIDPVAGAGKPALVADGFHYLEGPAWHAPSGALYFVDPRKSELYRWPGKGKVERLAADSGGSGGIAIGPGDTLVMAQATAHKVARLRPNGRMEPLAERAGDVPFDRPNDLVVRKDGTVYFSEPFTRQVVRIKPDGEAIVEWTGREQSKPNGIALSPDHRVLYLSDTRENLVRAFTVEADGHLTGVRVFATGLGMDPKVTWITDGMTVDEAGNVYVASYAASPESDGPGEIAVFAPNGARWGRIVIPRGPSNCAFGGEDGRTLFVTAQGALYALSMPIAGLRP